MSEGAKFKNGHSPSPLFDEFVKTLPPYGDPREAEIESLRQQLAETKALNARMLVEYEERMKQLAECERELDMWKETSIRDAKRIDELLRENNIADAIAAELENQAEGWLSQDPNNPAKYMQYYGSHIRGVLLDRAKELRSEK